MTINHYGLSLLNHSGLFEVDMNPNTEFAQLKIRIPVSLRKQLQAESNAQQRSLNAQVNFILKKFMQFSDNVQMKD